MTEEQKKRVAVFRFGVIHDLINGNGADQGSQEALLRQKCARRWEIPYSEKTRIGRSTILRWIRVYRQSNGKIESLSPGDRSDRGESRGWMRRLSWHCFVYAGKCRRRRPPSS